MKLLLSAIVEASSLVLLRLFIFILLLLFLMKISTHTHTHKVSSKKYTTSLQEADTVNTNINAMMKIRMMTGTQIYLVTHAGLIEKVL